MNNLQKGIAIASVVGLVGFGLHTCCHKRPERTKGQEIGKVVEAEYEKGMADVLGFIDKNYDSHETIVNYILELREKRNLWFSEKTVDNLADLFKREAEKYPWRMKEHIMDVTAVALRSGYRNEIFDRLSVKEKSEILEEALKYKTRKCMEETGDVAIDAIDKARETKLYDRVRRAGENFFRNVRRRIFK